jgi:16S rRNA (uracil1498-N3)-methyltransferase
MTRLSPRLFVEVDAAAPDEGRIAGPAVSRLHALRLGPGSEVVAIVGPGRERRATIVALARSEARLRLGEELPRTDADPRSPLVLAIALADLPRLDLVVEKATELGATAIWAFVAERSQTRDVSASRRDRWRRIGRAACEQCGRTVPPEIDAPLSLQALGDRIEATPGAVLLDPAGPRWDGSPPADERGRIVVVGPEGGLTGTERADLCARGAAPLSLGPRILRFETAAIAALAWASWHRHGRSA